MQKLYIVLHNTYATQARQRLSFAAHCTVQHPTDLWKDSVNFGLLQPQLSPRMQMFASDMFVAGFLSAKSDELLPEKDDPTYEQQLVGRIAILNSALSEAKLKYEALGKSVGVRTEVLDALRKDGKAAAIRVYRQRTGSGLKEAMDFVSSLESVKNADS